jgi:alpha-D-ribose 1-methylphosphonate 5-triphosphate synthase subunit PhnH
MTMNDGTLASAGLDVWQPALQQHVFRRLLDCFAYPGRIASSGDNDHEALITVLATLLDGETSLADPHNLIAAADWPKLQARPDAADSAAFVVADGTRAPDFTPQLGTLESPERGATVVLAVTALGTGQRLRLSGPGIDGDNALAVSGLHPGWIDARADWVTAFPLGVDLILCDGARFAALPRTTHIAMEID